MSVGLALVFMSWWAWQDGDRVEFVDLARGQRVARMGKIKSEDAVRVVLEATSGPVVTISVAALVDVVYDGTPAEVFVARNQERQRNWEAAAAQYQVALLKLPAGPSLLRRHLEFKRVEMLALRAEVSDAAQRTAARMELRRWLGQHGNTRQTPRALDLLWRLADDDAAGQGEALGELKKLAAAVPRDADLARLCSWLEIQWSMRDADRFWSAAHRAELTRRLGELAPRLAEFRKNADGPMGAPIFAWHAVALAAQGKTEEALAAIDQAMTQAETDRAALATLYLGRGLVQRLGKNPAEAVWSLLWVDVVYHDDPETRALALFHLADVFSEQDQGRRARQYRERLRGDPALADTWARRVESRRAAQP